MPDLEQSEGDFHYRIGIYTNNASKHTYIKILREIFPCNSPEDFQPRAIKGINSWSRQLLEKTRIINSWGDLDIKKIILKKPPAQLDAAVKIKKQRKERKKRNKTRITTYLWPLIKKVNWVVFMRIISLIIAILLYNISDFYIHTYKKVHLLEPSHFEAFSGLELLYWFCDWRTPGLPKVQQNPHPLFQVWYLLTNNWVVKKVIKLEIFTLYIKIRNWFF